eukprot:jgi/Botrbrau1/16499/Bobra.0142s0093.1
MWKKGLENIRSAVQDGMKEFSRDLVSEVKETGRVVSETAASLDVASAKALAERAGLVLDGRRRKGRPESEDSDVEPRQLAARRSGIPPLPDQDLSARLGEGEAGERGHRRGLEGGERRHRRALPAATENLATCRCRRHRATRLTRLSGGKRATAAAESRPAARRRLGGGPPWALPPTGTSALAAAAPRLQTPTGRHRTLGASAEGPLPKPGKNQAN